MTDRYVLGYSGINESLSLFREQHPTAPLRLSGLSQGADSAAALLKNGQVFSAISEERVTRKKGTGSFPAHAVRELLREAGLGIGDLDAIAHGFMYDASHFPSEILPLSDRRRFVYGAEAQRVLWREHFGTAAADLYTPVAHHRAHARMGHALSGGKDGVVIVMDGRGETSSTSIFSASKHQLTLRGAVSATHSLGVLYSLVTYHLGFKPGEDEYKVMALASYGDPSRFRTRFREYVKLQDAGSYSVPLLTHEKDWQQRDLHSVALERLTRETAPPRHPGLEVDQVYMDLAASLQERFEEAVLHVSRWARGLTGATHATLTGGSALNCVAMTKVMEAGVFGSIAVPPAAGDEGTAVGAALEMCEPSSTSQASTVPDWGSSYSDVELETCSPPSGWERFIYGDADRICKATAQLLAAGGIVAWFQGGMEFGARALGFRSILADPRTEAMKDKVNRLVKQREGFRPFAPAVPEERAAEYFNLDPRHADRYRYMTLVARPRLEAAERLRAVIHVDGTSRVQTVHAQGNPRFWSLLHEFGRIVGTPVLLNTSFNVNGQPIVRTPSEALDTANRAGLDAVVLGRTLFRREGRVN